MLKTEFQLLYSFKQCETIVVLRSGFLYKVELAVWDNMFSHISIHM